jgi:hypothetical protein
MRINPLFAQSDKKLSREVAPSEFFRLALAGAAPTSNPFQPDLGAVKLVKNAFVHGIHQGADAGSPGRALFPDLDPHIRTRRPEAGIIIDLVDAFGQAVAALYQLKLHFHGWLLTHQVIVRPK